MQHCVTEIEDPLRICIINSYWAVISPAAVVRWSPFEASPAEGPANTDAALNGG